MLTIVFEPSALGGAKRAEAPCGARLIDVCDAAGAPVPFSCRSASCGTCRIDVIEGIELLERAAEDELEVLRLFACPPSQRLACQARLRGASGIVRVRATDD